VHIRNSLLAFVLPLLLPVMAQASVFLVQLGSHPNENAADQAWQELTQESPEILSGLQHRKSEILLPPAGTPVYRLQAGPFQNRLEALKLCEDLRPTGQDCFVVETVLFEPQPQSAPSQSARMAEIAPPPPAADMPAAENRNNASRAASAGFVEAVEDRSSGQSAPAPAAASNYAAESDLPWLDASDAPSLPWQSATAVTPPVVTTPPPPALPELPATAPAQSYDAPEVRPQPAVNSQTARFSAPPAPVISAQLPAPSGSRTALQPMPATNPQNTRYIPPARRARPAASLPWNARDDRSERSAARMTPPVAPPPMMDAPAGRASSMNPPVAGAYHEDDSLFVGGNVEVAEAIPVPLSEDEPLQIPESQAEVKLFSGMRAPGWGAKPSSNLLQQTFWANIHAFPSRQHAMRFWEALRSRLPEDANGLRARITTPYTGYQSDQRVSLQLGPFRSLDNLNRLCDFARQGSLRCEPRKTMGASATAAQPRYRASNRWSNTRRVASRPSVPNAVSGAYWVQIGSFASEGRASRRWQDIQQQFTELDGMQPFISQPRLSSSANPVYRLRTGPFATRYAAQYTCDQLRMGGQTCLVVRE
jgi:hypothetical protein